MNAVGRRFFSQGCKWLKEQVLLSKYDPVQVGHLSEKCIAVDEDDNIIGGVTKGSAHNVATLSLHRAFSLFAFTPDKRLILQKRSAKKITFPCLWTNTCCSHPLLTANEQTGTAGVVAAVVRKVEHELGVVDLDPKDCYVMGRFLYKAVEADAEWGEQELDYAVVVRNFAFDQVSPNPQEVSDVKAVDEQELAQWLISEYSSFSPWFQLFYRLRFLSEWWSNIDRIEHYPVDMNIVRMN